MIDWFKELKDKKTLTFLEFDIVEFYPNITEEILVKALDYAKQYVTISRKDMKIILQTKKALLFSEGKTWTKKGRRSFDVSMGSWDGAEVADLVGLYMLSQLTHLKFNIGLYRDDGLAVTNLSPRLAELEKKKVCKIFNNNGFNITANVNVKNVNFLDIQFDLETDTYRPFMKPNETPIYVSTESNHPSTIIKNIPKAVNLRLSKISSNKEIFDSAKHPFQEALKKSGHDYNLTFEPVTHTEQRKENRSRNITYFNPPFSKNVKTNVGAQFLKLIDTLFPEGHGLKRLMNRNNIKISYRCMPNLKKKISNHNFKILKPEEQTEGSGCNCSGVMGPCPLDGNCLIDSVIYRAEVTDEHSNETTYTGLTSNTFKKRYYSHRQSFNERNLQHSTTLSSHIWNLKDKNLNYSVKWKTIDRAPRFNPVTKKCRLCLKEKYYIIFQPEGAKLNERSELFSTCRHRTRDLLSKI